ncbi:MAG: TIM-barrel domain-containing protein [Clostridiales bacterium]
MLTKSKIKTKSDVKNDFYFDGKNYQKGTHYTCLDYVPVSNFTPLSGTNWWRLNNIVNASIQKNKVDIEVECVKCDDITLTQNKVLRIEVISYDRNIYRVRFNQYAEEFSDYDIKENEFGPITRSQLNWIQNQNSKSANIHFDGKSVIIQLKDVNLTLSQNCFMTVKNKKGEIIHQDGWVNPPNIDNNSKPQGIVFVDQENGSASAVIKNLNKDQSGNKPNFYGCAETQNYYETGDNKQNHSSSLDHKGQAVSFFNYDNYEMDQEELKPVNEKLSESNSEQPFIPQYVTAPFFIEYPDNLNYAYGFLLDNVSQSYMNFGNREYTGAIDPETTKNLDNVYYVGAQYPELDYYLIFPSDNNGGDNQKLLASIIDNYTILTGKENKQETKLNLRGAMPPKYIFGFFQGVYGFTGLDSGNWSVKSVVDGYRESNIPLEGLAIDVDVQNEYEVFTTNGAFWDSGIVGQGDSVFQWAHKQDLVCQTNITNFIRNDKENYKVYNTITDSKLYTECSKFIDYKNQGEGSPYTALLPYTGTTAIFPHFGNPKTPEWWGRNYWDKNQLDYPLLTIGLDFVWQDMTVPAMSPHILGNSVYNQSYNNIPGNNDLTSGIFNWKTYHGQQLYGDPRYPGTLLPYIAIRNLHAYMECKATYEHGLTIKDNYPTKFQRSYIISRGGYTGLAHFGGFWTGDNVSGWKYMQIEIPKVLNLSLCGFPITGSDVGGFAPSSSEDYNHCQEHLMVRWVQAACLLPWFRDHYVNFNHGGKAFQEIYKFDWDYNGRSYSDIMNDFVKMRIRFHHVLYDSMYKFCQTGLPPVKPTCLYEGGSNSPETMKGFVDCQDSQYFIGDEYIMLAPAMEDENCETLTDHTASNYPATIKNHPIWIPNVKKWFPYDAASDGPCNPHNNFSPTEGSFGYYQGDGCSHNFTVPLEKMPVFIREGAIIPTRITRDGSVKNIQQLDKDNEPFVFDIWPSKINSNYQCYFDDSGETREAELNGNYSLITLNQSINDDNWSIDFSCNYNKYELPESLYLRLRASENGNVYDNKNNKYIKTTSLQNLFNQNKYSYFYDTNKNELWIKLNSENLDKLKLTKEGLFNIIELSL